MTKGIRFRILALQAGLILVLGGIAGFMLWAGNFTHTSVTQQLAAQEIVFPSTSNAEFKALPAANQAAMGQYANQTMTTGDQAEIYANDFIGFHLSSMPTYSAASSAARANPTNTKDASTLATVTTGTELRAMLLNAYGWWTVGTYAIIAGMGLAIAAFLVLVALGFELWRWRVAVQAEAPVRGSLPQPSLEPSGVGITQFTEHKG
jgi:hypothetical protein